MAEQRPKPKKRFGNGVLPLIACLLLSSALIRITLDARAAFAFESDVHENAEAMMPALSEKEPVDMAELDTLLVAFQDREARLATREIQIEMRVQALAVADREIERKLAVLIQAENRLKSTLAYASTAAEDDLARLTTVYENMKSKDAAALFEQMDPKFAAGFLGRMRADAAAGIMAGLEPQTAYAVSILLAGRNANVPKN